jgi:D-glycero-alpha-D-manno-heptose-7-phosphate kinase
VLLELEDLAAGYPVAPGRPRTPRHPLLEAAIDLLPPPEGIPLAVRVRAGVPPGCGTGTSASLAVAALAALARARGESPLRHELVSAAHRLEVEVLGGESGVQDQVAAAYGGINYIEIDPYPEMTVTPLPAWPELTSLLVLVYLGRPHLSTAVHREVIETLRHGRSGSLDRLRHAADIGRRAVMARDLLLFGQAMIANTEAQRSLHPGLVGPDAARVMDVAAGSGAMGWKVNGAGGDGGSVSLLAPDEGSRSALVDRIEALGGQYRVLPAEGDRAGLQVRGAL